MKQLCKCSTLVLSILASVAVPSANARIAHPDRIPTIPIALISDDPIAFIHIRGLFHQAAIPIAIDSDPIHLVRCTESDSKLAKSLLARECKLRYLPVELMSDDIQNRLPRPTEVRKELASSLISLLQKSDPLTPRVAKHIVDRIQSDTRLDVFQDVEAVSVCKRSYLTEDGGEDIGYEVRVQLYDKSTQIEGNTVQVFIWEGLQRTSAIILSAGSEFITAKNVQSNPVLTQVQKTLRSDGIPSLINGDGTLFVSPKNQMSARESIHRLDFDHSHFVWHGVVNATDLRQ